MQRRPLMPLSAVIDGVWVGLRLVQPPKVIFHIWLLTWRIRDHISSLESDQGLHRAPIPS